MTCSSLWTGQRMLNCLVLIAALRSTAAGLVHKSSAMRVIPQRKEKTTHPPFCPIVRNRAIVLQTVNVAEVMPTLLVHATVPHTSLSPLFHKYSDVYFIGAI